MCKGPEVGTHSAPLRKVEKEQENGYRPGAVKVPAP